MRVLFLALLVSGAAFAEEFEVRKFVQARRDAFVGRKKNLARNPALENDGRMTLTNEGDFLSEYVEAFNPVAAAGSDKAKIREAAKKLQAWSAGERKRADALLGESSDRLAEIEAWHQGKETWPFSLLVAEGDDELASAARACLAASKPVSGNDVRSAQNLFLGILRRWNSLDAWRALLLRWFEEDARHLLDYDAAHPDLGPNTSLLHMAGGEHLVRAKLDVAAIQRLAEDLLVLEGSEKGAANGAPSALAPSLRRAWRELVKEAGSEDLEVLLASALEDRFHNAVVSHQLWKYENAKCVAKAAGVLKAWKARGGSSVLGMLEVLAYRQGTVFSTSDASDRFHENLLSFDATGERADVFERAQRTVAGWYSGWKYRNAETMAKSFEEKHADCFNVGNLQTSLMGNQGVDGIYPVMMSGDSFRHLQTAMRLGERFVTRDGAGGPAGEFPKGYGGETRMVVLWLRTVDGWVDAQTYDTEKKSLLQRAVPYYGIEAETVEDVK